MKVHVEQIEFAVTGCRTRMPFRYGIVTLEHAPSCTARVTIETEGGARAEGYAADILAPKWFAKDPEKSLERDFLDLAESARAAAREYRGANEGTVFELWWRTYRERVASLPFDAPDRLVRGFGVALLERALIDATCRAAGKSFHAALREDLLGFRPGVLSEELTDWTARDDLPKRARPSVRVRHTVGMLDPLRAADIAEEDRLHDGLPQALDEVIATYGVNLFKVKLGGDLDEDLSRLRAVCEVLGNELGVDSDWRWTLDGNEQFSNAEHLAQLLESFVEESPGARMLERLLWVEQPLARGDTLDPIRLVGLDRVSGFAPVIIDEADTGLDSFPRAIERGYSGVSVKNCKGVFRALTNRARCRVMGPGLFQTAEDLTNLPVLALQQDLATVAALDLPHAERNGHHYFRGLDHLPEAERTQALEKHPGLYREDVGGIFLDVRDGALDLRSLGCVGYGHDVTPHMTERTALDVWEASVRP